MLQRSAWRYLAIACVILTLFSPMVLAQHRNESRRLKGGAVPWTPQAIDDATARAKQWIYSKQNAGGHWEPDATRQGDDHMSYTRMQGDSFGGYTALATYALLAAGESPNDPRIKAAVQFLKTADIVGIYAIAMRCQVWLLIPHDSPEMRALIRKDAQTLFDGMNDGSLNPKNNGLWDYLGKGPRLDHSVSQYGVLGLWACQQTGAIDVGSTRWKTMETAWRSQQYPSGGWDYGMTQGETPSMTAAGVASLFIIDDYLRADEGVGCTGNPINPWIDKGLHWIDEHYRELGINGYAYYGIERIGAASGFRYFAKRDWYNDLGQRLLVSQNEDGSFVVTSYPGGRPLDATCFALLFLARGRAPVMMNKLDYHLASSEAHSQMVNTPVPTQPASQPTLTGWEQRPRDLANLTAWTGRQLETFLQWQIVNLDVPPEDLHDAPILYISGSGPLAINAEYADRLKIFVQQGGMVLANADCGSAGFSRSLEALGRQLFGHKFHPLSADHPIFTHEQFPASRWRKRPLLRGLSNGVRELMLLIPEDDPARWWQLPRASASHAAEYELGIDIYEYANDRQVWKRGAGYMVKLDPAATTTRKVKVARLVTPGNWDPEPGGWPRLTTILHNQDETDVLVYPAKPGSGELAAATLAHLTGTGDLSLSPAAKLELKTYVQNGGTLVIDAAGGSTQFADSAEALLKELFGPAAEKGLVRPLPPDHPLYKIPAHSIENFTYRSWTRLRTTGELKAPRVRGIEIKNRIAVFFSREDLSAGLVGEPVDGIIGYSPETATDIMRNILLYSVRPASTAPAAR